MNIQQCSVNIRSENLLGSHLHWSQEGREGDDVACKEGKKKGAKISHLQKLAKSPKAGISCDKLRRYISGLFFPSFESKDRRGFIFVFLLL